MADTHRSFQVSASALFLGLAAPTFLLAGACASVSSVSPTGAPRSARAAPSASESFGGEAGGDFGVLLMAHGGDGAWNSAVLDAVAPLRQGYPLEVAFGMADAATIQEAVRSLELRGVRRIGVVRLFISGESWYARTEQILGLRQGAPERVAEASSAKPVSVGQASHHEHMPSDSGHGGHSMAFWRIATQSAFALSTEGLAEDAGMGTILLDRARVLSRQPEAEDVLVLAHGPGDDGENERWLRRIDACLEVVRRSVPFRRVEVQTLREDWPDKRVAAEQRIRAFVQRASDESGAAIVIPFRVYGFGPYREVLDGLAYRADGRGLLPHELVTRWIDQQATSLRAGPFQKPLEP